MPSNPLIQAVEHFSLPQLMADTNLCRNVLNDIGAPPSEVFVLIAALEARIPQTLLEHTATNDLSVVEPRLITELNERGVERSRAEWAVNAWKEVIGGTTLGQETVIRPSTSLPTAAFSAETVRPSQPQPLSQPPAAPAPPPVVAPRPAAPAPIPQPQPQAPRLPPPPPPVGPPLAAAPPPRQPATTTPPPPGGKRKRLLLVIAAIVVALLIAGIGVVLGRASNNSKTKASASSSSSSSSSSPGAKTSGAASTSPSTAASPAPAANISASLGAAKAITVPATVAWTDTGLMVTKGERINVTTTGQVANAPGSFNGPDGVSGFEIYSIIGGGRHAGLIGLIAGSNTPFFVGSSYNDVALASGELYLGINDVGVANNSGQFAATVRLQQS